MVTAGILPLRGNSHGRTENRTRDLMISSQRLWPLDHEAGLYCRSLVCLFCLVWCKDSLCISSHSPTDAKELEWPWPQLRLWAKSRICLYNSVDHIVARRQLVACELRYFATGGIRNEKNAFNTLPGKAEIERRNHFETYELLINGYFHFITNSFCKYVLKRATSKPRLGIVFF